MAPIRRYLRVTKHTVLECRIYLDKPGLADTWFLRPRDPVLPRVIESIRPLILPKLREEEEKSRGKGRKTNKGIKDVVVQDDFEVVLFLTQPSTRHAILTKHKTFVEPVRAQQRKEQRSIMTTDRKDDRDGDGNGRAHAPVLVREESDEEQDVDMRGVAPDANGPGNEAAPSGARPRTITRSSDHDEEDDDDDKEDGKKLMTTTYDGFSIYSRVLCLIVKRREGGRERGKERERERSSVGGVAANAPAMLENWIASTQLPPEDEAD